MVTSDPTARRAAPGRPQGIRRLPDTLVDQIAAGEVVERPASVVKELVENALDAGAQRIRVGVREGGRAWIGVEDDGWGMSADQARLALERHATSKVRIADDLLSIHSFGFRGEALPAIASVSRFRLRTRERGAAEGFELRVEAGRSPVGRAVGCAEGTRVEVADLFAGVPARRKFLKAASTEWGHIAEWMARIGLAAPHVHFDLRRDDRAALVWPAVDEPLERIAAVLSDAEASAMVAVRSEQGEARLEGFASRPDQHRPTAAGIHLFVNQRPVRDRLLRHALLEHYRDVLPRGRYPSAVLFVSVPPEAVDVNVHPAKWEVRFTEPRAIHRLVSEALREATMARQWLGGGAPWRGGAPTAPATHPGPAPDSGSRPGSDWILATGAGSAAPVAGALPAQPAQVPEPLRFSELRLLGQLFGTYLVAEAKGSLVLIDQHAAHERVLYERLRAEWLEGGVERQGLLVTTPVELEPGLAEALLAEAETLERIGFEIEAFGEGAVAVRAVPALLADRDPVALARGLGEEVRASREHGTRFAPSSRILQVADRTLATLACHSARRAGDVLSGPEQRALLDSLDTIPWAATCPHGRPVATALDLPELERRFGRR